MVDARDVVEAQYAAWAYPLPIPDLAEAVDSGELTFDDPALYRRKFWPRNVEPAALEILVAGCGTNQAALLAFTNPECHVVGVDISESSLGHQRLLKEKHRLDNLDVRRLPLEQVDELNQSFDFITSTGVLHHLADPDRGLRALRDVLAPHGVLSIMLYAYYGRIGVYMLQEALRLLGSEQDVEGLELVRHILDAVPDWHPVNQYVEFAPDLDYDAGLVDTFLHKSDRAYTVSQVLRLAEDNGLEFQGWLDNVNYSLSARLPHDDLLRERVAAIDKADQWRLIELALHVPATHRFLLCHVDRPKSDYVLDFSDEEWLDYVPSLRPPLNVVTTLVMTTGSITDQPSSGVLELQRAGHSVALDALGSAVLDLVDGATPIRDLIEKTSHVVADAGWDSAEHVEAARAFFQQMAEWDHFQFEIP